MIQTSAPAKIILFGEHAVVYNQPAIAVPVSSLRASATVDFNTTGTGLHVHLSDINRTLPIDVDSDLVDDGLAVTARITLKHLQASPPSATITLTSQIPMASGLGSGAAVSTALARALSLAVDKPLATAELNAIVYEIEKLYHGTPSGIDNSVIVYEEPVYFVRGQEIEHISIGKPFKFLIADTGKAALTRVSVGDVRALYEREPAVIQPVLDKIGAIVVEARAAIEAGDGQRLGSLMGLNHACLQQLTVSSPELDALVAAALSAGALGAKLSGGGRGGNMIALVTDENTEAVREALSKAGAVHVFETIVA